jgi:hypothetical protein
VFKTRGRRGEPTLAGVGRPGGPRRRGAIPSGALHASGEAFPLWVGSTPNVSGCARCGPQVGEPANHWTSSSGSSNTRCLVVRSLASRRPSRSIWSAGEAQDPAVQCGSWSCTNPSWKSGLLTCSSTSIPMGNRPAGSGRHRLGGPGHVLCHHELVAQSGHREGVPYSAHRFRGTRPRRSRQRRRRSTPDRPVVRLGDWGRTRVRMVIYRGRGRRYGYGRPGRRVRGYYRARSRTAGPIPGCLLPLALCIAVSVRLARRLGAPR